MKETKIFSKNSTFQKFEVLKTNRNKRYRYNEFLVEGVRSLNEAVKNNWKIKSFLYDPYSAAPAQSTLSVYYIVNFPKAQALKGIFYRSFTILLINELLLI